MTDKTDKNEKTDKIARTTAREETARDEADTPPSRQLTFGGAWVYDPAPEATDHFRVREFDPLERAGIEITIFQYGSPQIGIGDFAKPEIGTPGVDTIHSGPGDVDGFGVGVHQPGKPQIAVLDFRR